MYQSIKVINVINTFYSLVTFQNTYKMASQLNNLAWTTYKKNPNLYIWLGVSFSFHFPSCFLCFFILPLHLVFLYLSLSSLVSFLFFFYFFYPFTFHSMEEVEEAHFSFAMYNREMFRIVVDLIYDGQYKS